MSITMPMLANKLNNLLALEPRELGTEMLFIIKETLGRDTFVPPSLIRELSSSPEIYSRWPQQRTAIEEALYKAFSWLESEALVVPIFDSQQNLGWRRLSLLAMRLRDGEDLAHYLGPKDIAPPSPGNTYALRTTL